MLPRWADAAYRAELNGPQGSGDPGLFGIAIGVIGISVLLYSIFRR